MKIISAILFRWPSDEKTPKVLAKVFDVSSFGFFQRSTVKQWAVFFSSTIIERTKTSQRQSVAENDYICHAFVRYDGLSGAAICDKEYPSRVAFSFVNKIMDDFASKYSKVWDKENQKFDTTDLESDLEKFQDPKSVDKLTKIQKELDETKIIIRDTIESALERGEKLDTLIDRSEILSNSSKQFYRTAKKQNQCCIIL
ncbi:synaptobrevin [Anaeramoeba ignava]|uniref:Synaptobrevin n=1 Tax=Anaeramoeba ignava TaxID=1746090 RepID=A0A9Q0LRA4_ANAIG|nr:synaptobrevin [Anaeramoeba ignava]|eukprot:Anaeramoba_ignava/a222882_26.p1 GENE.a222882_26~~a222882_26.p1  ORF type:complete len:209 (+),score=77.02 a222882_26:33-629(+)